MKNKILLILVIVIIASGAYYFTQKDKEEPEVFQEQINFQIPENIATGYTSFQDWRIKVIYDETEYPSNFTIVDGQIDCEETPPEGSLPSGINKKVIGDRVYCIERVSEGAAGSVYTTYNYSTIYDNSLVSISFVTRCPNCYNFDDPAQTDCIKERETFDLDALINGIIEKNN